MFGVRGAADLSSQKRYGHAYFAPVFGLDRLHDLLLYFLWIGTGGYTQARGHTHHMQIDNNSFGLLYARLAHNNVGRLSSYARELGQLVHGHGYVLIVFNGLSEV